MTTLAGSMNWQDVVGIGTANPTTKQLQSVGCGMGRIGRHVVKEGARGSRSPQGTGVADGPYTTDGPLMIQPSIDEWQTLLPFILGTAVSGTTYALADQPYWGYLQQDKGVKVPLWDFIVGKATISASAGSPILTCALELHGKTETLGNAGTFPAISASLTILQPFLFQQMVATIGGTVRLLNEWTLTIDNKPKLDLFRNSQTRTDITYMGRDVTLGVTLPYNTSDTDLYNIAVAGMAATFVFTNGARVLTWDFVNLKAPPLPLDGASGEMTNRLNFVAYATAATKELVTTLV